MDVLLWAVEWESVRDFNKRHTGAKICFRKETLGITTDGLEGKINGGKTICDWLFHPRGCIRHSEGLEPAREEHIHQARARS